MEALALARLSIAVARASGPRDVAAALLDELALAIPEADVALCLHDEPAGEFELIGVRTKDGRSVEVRQRWSFAMATAARDVVLARKALALGRDEYVERYPEVARISDPARLAWYVALPILAGERAVGAVGLSWRMHPGLDDGSVPGPRLRNRQIPLTRELVATFVPPDRIGHACHIPEPC